MKTNTTLTKDQLIQEFLSQTRYIYTQVMLDIWKSVYNDDTVPQRLWLQTFQLHLKKVTSISLADISKHFDEDHMKKCFKLISQTVNTIKGWNVNITDTDMLEIIKNVVILIARELWYSPYIMYMITHQKHQIMEANKKLENIYLHSLMVAIEEYTASNYSLLHPVKLNEIKQHGAHSDQDHVNTNQQVTSSNKSSASNHSSDTSTSVDSGKSSSSSSSDSLTSVDSGSSSPTYKGSSKSSSSSSSDSLTSVDSGSSSDSLTSFDSGSPSTSPKSSMKLRGKHASQKRMSILSNASSKSIESLPISKTSVIREKAPMVRLSGGSEVIGDDIDDIFIPRKKSPKDYYPGNLCLHEHLKRKFVTSRIKKMKK